MILIFNQESSTSSFEEIRLGLYESVKYSKYQYNPDIINKI